MSKRKTARANPAKAVAAKKTHKNSAKLLKASNGAPAAAEGPPNPSQASRLLPQGGELKSLYQRYTQGSQFDDHDKAFYFVLDVGGISRAKQLIAHVEEVLAELEEFQG
jgi:hypothetical protein